MEEIGFNMSVPMKEAVEIDLQAAVKMKCLW